MRSAPAATAFGSLTANRAPAATDLRRILPGRRCGLARREAASCGSTSGGPFMVPPRAQGSRAVRSPDAAAECPVVQARRAGRVLRGPLPSLGAGDLAWVRRPGSRPSQGHAAKASRPVTRRANPGAGRRCPGRVAPVWAPRASPLGNAGTSVHRLDVAGRSGLKQGARPRASVVPPARSRRARPVPPAPLSGLGRDPDARPPLGPAAGSRTSHEGRELVAPASPAAPQWAADHARMTGHPGSARQKARVRMGRALHAVWKRPVAGV